MKTHTKELFSQLRMKLGEQNFQTWIEPTKFISWDEGLIKFEVPSKFFQNWLHEHYQNIIEQTGSSLTGHPTRVEFQISPYLKELKEPKVDEPRGIGFHRIRGRDILTSLKDLNPKFTFDRFVVGACNRFAHAASLAVSQDPGKAYNPLFLYGGVGLGKTHLMQAVARRILDKNRKSKVLYISSESFTNDFINAIANRTTDKFRRKYRNADALLIDDIHFLSGQVRTQDQFFHTFNVLWDSHKQIILSSDRPPNDIPDIEERLISRFEWGLVVDLQAPDRETRIAILRKEAEMVDIPVPDKIIYFIADRIKSNIRKLEGAFIQVLSYTSLTNSPLTVELAETLLAGTLEEEIQRCISIDEIQKKVVEFYDIRIADMKSSRRPKAVAFPRQIAMYLSRVMTENSLNEIGEAFGGRDHTTVLHACRSIEEKKSNDKDLSNTIIHLMKKIRQGTSG